MMKYTLRALFAFAAIQFTAGYAMEGKLSKSLNEAKKRSLRIKLEDAVTCDELDKATKYLDQQAPAGSSLFETAIANKSKEMVKLLLDKGVNANDQWTVYNPYGWTVAQKGNTPLILAACMNQTEICKLLLNANVDVNAQTHHGATALGWAERNNNRELIELLVAKGAEHPKRKDCCPSSCSIQ